MSTALATHAPLNVADRCDRCGAQAYIRATLASGGELLFCAHHGRAHEARLRELAAGIQDNTHKLTETTTTTARDEER